ncbi:hypothetical protein PsYK624_028330 [Phanerochaete sordida]|uniref:DUF6533 domain-containing protein n=1 Tax=Phanerochaete sordida TaxID=48140 RepID=A0A9P3G0J7_9APHY|nr:hypothetical protein PsYK624_028330 [Phanerochaete sordida]
MSNSTQNATTTQEESVTAAAYANFVRGNYFSMSSRVLFLWEFCVTFDDEVEYVWRGRWTPATILYMINRYVNVVITLLELLDQAPFQTEQCFVLKRDSCGPFVRVLQSLLVVALFIVAAFATIRVYAIWNYNWKPALLILLLSLISPIISIIMDVDQLPAIAPPPSVGAWAFLTIPHSRRLTIINRASTVAYDGVVLLLTVARAMSLRQDSIRLRVRDGIMALILRDGALYFLALLCINLTQIIMSAELAGNNNIAYYVSPMTSVLISRFLIDLRKAAAKEDQRLREATSVFLTTEIQGPSMFGMATDGLGIASLAGPLATSVLSPLTSNSDYPDTEHCFEEIHELQGFKAACDSSDTVKHVVPDQVV